MSDATITTLTYLVPVGTAISVRSDFARYAQKPHIELDCGVAGCVRCTGTELGCRVLAHLPNS